jgi:enoyl-CoA hydratase
VDFENIIYEKAAPVATITLNRPTKLNALSIELQHEVAEALLDAGWMDDSIRVIVLKGAGRAFSAGFDLGGAPARIDAVQTIRRAQQQRGFQTSWWERFWGNPKPIIAQIHGFCIAGGLATATFCDLRVCGEDARFGAPEIRTGGPYIPAIWPWIFGITKAKEMLFTGNLIDAQEAHRVGLVNRVVPNDQLEDTVQQLALTISKLPAVTVQYNKKLINMAFEQMNIRAVIERSSELEAVVNNSPDATPDLAEYRTIRAEQGLNAALSWNAERFKEEDAWFRSARERS